MLNGSLHGLAPPSTHVWDVTVFALPLASPGSLIKDRIPYILFLPESWLRVWEVFRSALEDLSRRTDLGSERGLTCLIAAPLPSVVSDEGRALLVAATKPHLGLWSRASSLPAGETAELAFRAGISS